MKTKKLSRFLSVLLAMVMVVGMLPTAWADGPTISGLDTVEVGKKINLTVSSLPDNSTVNWNCEDSAASVDPNGTVHGDSEGVATIKATVTSLSDSNTIELSKQITVTAAAATLTDIELGTTSLTMDIGEEISLSDITVTPVPNNAELPSVTWESNDPSVAKIESGKIVAVSDGPATLTASVSSSIKATCTVTVRPAQVTYSVSIPSSMTLSAGASSTLKINSKTPSNATVSWDVSPLNVIELVTDSGDEITVKAKEGVANNATAVITATAGGDSESTCTVTVTNNGPATVSGIEISADRTSIAVSGIANLTATVSPSDAVDKEIIWTASGVGIVSLASSGTNKVNCTVTGLKDGTSIITAKTKNGTTKTISITVTKTNIAVTGVSITPSTAPSVAVGKTTTLTAVIAPSNATNKNVTWNSLDTGIATVNSTTGIVTGKAVGTARIQVTTADGSKTAVREVKVVKATVSDITYTVASDKVREFSASDFNRVCTNYTGYTLSSVKFGSSSSRGTLVYDYSSGDDNTRISTSTNYYYSSSSSKKIDNITFIPDGSYTGDATFNYTGYDSQNTSYSGRVIITIEGPSGDINLKTGKNEPISLDSEDFQDVCDDMVGGTLKYVTFGTTSKGALYYDYDGSDEEKAGTSKYYYDESPLIDDLTFVPGKNTTGTASITFKGRNTKDKTFSGTLEITISTSGSSSITYKTDKNESVDLKSSDFNTYCNDEVGGSLEWIRFTSLPSSSKGTLYYKYDTSKEEEADKSTEYYRSESPDIDDLTFVPYKNYEGTVNIDFKGENTSGKSFSGSFSIKVGASSGSDGDVTYTAAAGSAVTFQASDFSSYCKSETGYNLDYVKFTSLPGSSTGTLYYDYSGSSSSNKKVATSTQYKRSSSPYLDKVTFVPAKSTSGDVDIKFSGKNTDGESFSGVVTITYTAVKDAATIRYSTGSDPVGFKVGDFENACNSRGGGSLSSVKFSLPNTGAGVLYYNYTSASQNGGLVSPSLEYGAKSGNQLLSYVSFVPTPGFAGTVTVTYTGTDSKGSTYTGYVEITVSTANTAPKFTDMGNAAWASEAVTYLYQKGITTGTGATTYNPSGKITRSDFVLMLQRAFNLTASTSDNFKDVPSNAYYAQAVAVAKALGIATGGGDGNFNPTANLTREDAMVFLQRTLNRTGRGVADAGSSYLDKFPDGKKVSSYAQGAVAALVQAGVIKGDDSGKLNPQGTLTRAEMAVILYRVLNK